MTTNYERIKNMSIEEMAKIFKQKQCEECLYCASYWEVCEAEDCWHFTNETYKQWLEGEATDEK